MNLKIITHVNIRVKINIMLEPNIYENITRINKLFIDNKFNVYNQSEPTTMNNNHPKSYNLSYTKSSHLCDEYKLNIHMNNSKINATIPLKKSNKSFITEFTSLDDVYNFLEYHIYMDENE